MPGKLCKGTDDVPNDVALSKAYCEGRAAARAGGTLVDDPHPAGSPASVAWLAGLASWDADPATNPLGRDCCADPLGGGYVAP